MMLNSVVFTQLEMLLQHVRIHSLEVACVLILPFNLRLQVNYFNFVPLKCFLSRFKEYDVNNHFRSLSSARDEMDIFPALNFSCLHFLYSRQNFYIAMYHLANVCCFLCEALKRGLLLMGKISSLSTCC